MKYYEQITKLNSLRLIGLHKYDETVIITLILNNIDNKKYPCFTCYRISKWIIEILILT